MPNTVIEPPTAHLCLTGTSFMSYANQYRKAAIVWLPIAKRMQRFDPVSYYLFCLSLELHLKSFIWLTDRSTPERIRKKYWHNLEKLWSDSKDRGIDKYAKATDLRDRVISLVGPYYRKRQFNYLDLDMVFSGYTNVREEPRIIPTLKRLTGQLDKSLHTPILHASQT